MKIAIFHDFFGTIGGGEKTVLTLAKAMNADVITTDVDADSIKKMGFDDVSIISLGETIKLPPLKQIVATIKFARCDFSNDYDFFIFSGNWAHHASKKHRPNLWYCYTPVRAFYDNREYIIKSQKSLVIRILARSWIRVHRHFDKKSVKNIEKIVAISKNTQGRIKKYHNRDTDIIYPPIPVREFGYEKNGDFWLSVSRLYPEKRIDLQIEAFRRLPTERLKIVGSYSEGDHAKKNLPDLLKDLPENVEIIGSVSEDELKRLYSDCKALVTTAMDEDFGMTPVEAMASGKPVVAVREGGYLETVVDGETGKFVRPDVDEIVDAVKEISKDPQKYKEACIERAKKFDVSVFIKKMNKTYIVYSLCT